MPPRFPSSSLAGKRANTWLASGYLGVLTGILGDLDYLSGTPSAAKMVQKREFLCSLSFFLPMDHSLGRCSGKMLHGSANAGHLPLGLPGKVEANVAFF